jgi:hypothetical protein
MPGSRRTLEVIDPLVEGGHKAGATLAVIGAADGVVHAGNPPHPPPRERIVRREALPDVVPLLAWSQSLIPHVAVLAGRAHADLAARVADEPEWTARAALGTGAEVRVLGPAADGLGACSATPCDRESFGCHKSRRGCPVHVGGARSPPRPPRSACAMAIVIPAIRASSPAAAAPG